VYEGGIRVPLIASWPGKIAAGASTNHLSAQYDMVATLSDLTRFSMEEPGDGISFLPTLLGKPQHTTHPFLLWAFPEYGGQLALRNDSWKFIQRGLNDPDDSPAPELYNLAVDSLEQKNVAAENPVLVDSLKRILLREYAIPETPRFRLTKWEEVNGL
jgi:arylsulfatase